MRWDCGVEECGGVVDEVSDGLVSERGEGEGVEGEGVLLVLKRGEVCVCGCGESKELREDGCEFEVRWVSVVTVGVGAR